MKSPTGEGRQPHQRGLGPTPCDWLAIHRPPLGDVEHSALPPGWISVLDRLNACTPYCKLSLPNSLSSSSETSVAMGPLAFLAEWIAGATRHVGERHGTTFCCKLRGLNIALELINAGDSICGHQTTLLGTYLGWILAAESAGRITQGL